MDIWTCLGCREATLLKIACLDNVSFVNFVNSRCKKFKMFSHAISTRKKKHKILT